VVFQVISAEEKLAPSLRPHGRFVTDNERRPPPIFPTSAA
jgi:hypothetical protein